MTEIPTPLCIAPYPITPDSRNRLHLKVLSSLEKCTYRRPNASGELACHLPEMKTAKTYDKACPVIRDIGVKKVLEAVASQPDPTI